MIPCVVYFDSMSSGGLAQIYTGLVQLHRQRVIRLQQRICRQASRWYGVRLLLDGRIPVYYDLHDGAILNTEALDEADWYFKRSYRHEHSQISAKIVPFGLNYSIHNDRTDYFRLVREASFGGLLRRIKYVLQPACLGSFPTARHLESPPKLDQPVKVLLMTRLWSDRALAGPVTPPAEEINFTRAQCIRLLKREFGGRFFGGVSPDEFSCKYFSDVVLPHKRWSQPRAYLSQLAEFPICVTTMGLHGSNGYRLAEYVAHSKAIVTERLAYEVPGDFKNEINYLEFVTPEECVEATVRLVDSSQRRREMMVANFRYYQAFLRPDSLILNTLVKALAEPAAETATPQPLCQGHNR